MRISSRFTADCLHDKWLMAYGPMEELLLDQGPEFFLELCELFGIQMTFVPLDAKHKMGKAERHGAIAKVMVLRTVTELKLEQPWEVRYAVTQCFAAKNSLLRSSGYSPI